MLSALAIVVVAFGVVPTRVNAGPSWHTATSSGSAHVLDQYGKLRLRFEPNRGQTDEQVQFIVRGGGYTLFLTQSEAVFSLQQTTATMKKQSGVPQSDPVQGALAPSLGTQGVEHLQDSVLRLQLVGANPHVTFAGINQLPGKSNYIRGNDPAKWNTKIPAFAKVQYSGIFPGIDLVYYGNSGHLEYDFLVSPGADSRLIRLNLKGTRNLRVDSRTGDLVMSVGKEELRFHKPIAYQKDPADQSQRHLVEATYRLDARKQVSVLVSSYDHSQPLVIDPTLSYSTYLGGSSNDYATAIAADSAGNAYVTGYTNSTNFPTTTGAYQTSCSGGCSGTTVDAFVSKIDPTGTSLIYSTYLGGSANDYGNGITLNASGEAYLVGQTFSSNFPVTSGVFQSQCGGGSCVGGDAFVTELNAEGSGLVFSTYLEGSGINQGNAVVLDASDNVYVTGYTESLTFPTTPGAFQTSCACSTRFVAFVTELNPSASALVYSTYLGGTGGDVGYALALDSAKDVYVTGYTHSTNFPTTAGAFQTTLNADTAAFVTKLNSTGSALIYSTYLGGTTTLTTQCEACATNVAVDSSGNAYVCGLTAESNFPTTPGAYQTTFVGPTNGHDAFLTKLNSTGTGLVYSTYLGGNGDTGATGIALDTSNNVWLKGNTKSSVFPVTTGAFQTVLGGGFDAFVSEIDPTGSQLLYSTYLGGSGTEYGGATRVLALDNQVPPNVYVVGYTNSTNFPVTAGSLQTHSAGVNDAFVAKFATGSGSSSGVVFSPTSLTFASQLIGTSSVAQSVTLSNTGSSSLTITSIAISGDFLQTNNCGSSLTAGANCKITVTFKPTKPNSRAGAVTVTDNATGSPQSVPLTGTGTYVKLSPASLIFGTVTVGTSSSPQVATFTNASKSALAIKSLTISGTNSLDFSETNTCGVSVAAGKSCTISVIFKPTASGARSASVSIVDAGGGSPQLVNLSGTGR
jgi:hypothetical protein